MDDYQRTINPTELGGELKETDLDYIARFDLPNIDKKNIKINVIETSEVNVLEMFVRRDYERIIETSHSREVSGSHERIRRIMHIKGKIDRAGIKTKYERGVLEIIIPKRS